MIFSPVKPTVADIFTNTNIWTELYVYNMQFCFLDIHRNRFPEQMLKYRASKVDTVAATFWYYFHLKYDKIFISVRLVNRQNTSTKLNGVRS